MPILQELMLFLKGKGNDDYIESIVAYFGAPVLADVKCASLINLSRCGRWGGDILRDWLSLRSRISERFSVEFSEMSTTERSVLILMYREQGLRRALSPAGVRRFLAGLGYPSCDGGMASTASCVDRLRERFRCTLPHEVGLFLDYPLEDVVGFIENGGRNAKFAGYWKVYGDEVGALRKFEAYRQAEKDCASILLGKAQGLTEAA